MAGGKCAKRGYDLPISRLRAGTGEFGVRLCAVSVCAISILVLVCFSQTSTGRKNPANDVLGVARTSTRPFRTSSDEIFTSEAQVAILGASKWALPSLHSITLDQACVGG